MTTSDNYANIAAMERGLVCTGHFPIENDALYPDQYQSKRKNKLSLYFLRRFLLPSAHLSTYFGQRFLISDNNLLGGF